MQYWIPKTLTIGVILGLSGCSVFTNDAHHERNYRVNETIKVPEGLEVPLQDPEFKMPVSTHKNDPQAIGYRPPQQVLTLAAGSWVEENEQRARVFFDKNDGIDDLTLFIANALDNVLKNHGTTSLSKDDSKGIVETDWYSIIKPVEGWFWESEEIVSKQKFRFIIEQKEHQRTASISAELLDYKSEKVPLNDLLKQQLEVRAVNEVISEFDYLYRVFQMQLRKQQGKLAMELGFNSQGDTAFITKQSTESVIERFPTLLERLNFTIIKIDTEKGVISTRYESTQSSVWDSIWGDEGIELPLQSGDYFINVSQLDQNKTALTWKDSEGKILNNDTLQQLHSSITAALQAQNLNM